MGTRIFVTKDAAEAGQTAGFWLNKPGYGGASIGPTDTIEVTSAETEEVLWKSTDPGPWYMVVATQDPCKAKSNARAAEAPPF